MAQNNNNNRHGTHSYIHPLNRALPEEIKQKILNIEAPKLLDEIKSLSQSLASQSLGSIDSSQQLTIKATTSEFDYDELAENQALLDDDDEMLVMITDEERKDHRNAQQAYRTRIRSVARLLRLNRLYSVYLKHQYPDPVNDRLFIVNNLWLIASPSDTLPLPMRLQTRIVSTISSMIAAKYYPLIGKLVFSWQEIHAIIEKHRDSRKNENRLRIGSHENLHRYFESLIDLAAKAAWYYADPKSVAEELHQKFVVNSPIANSVMLKESELEKAMLGAFFPTAPINALDTYSEQWLKFWEQMDRSRVADSVFSRLLTMAIKNADVGAGTGAFDLEMHVPWFFTKIQNLLDITVPGTGEWPGYSISELNVFIPKDAQRPVLAARLVMALLGRTASAIRHLTLLLHSIETFFHPSNMSRGTSALASFLTRLIKIYCKRMGTEKAMKDELGADKVKGTIRVEESRALLKAVLPLLEMMLFSKDPSVKRSSISSLHQIAWIAPQMVSDRFVPLIEASLDPENLVRTHQAPAAMSALTGFVHPFMRLRPNFFVSRLMPILENCLPGIDPNDTPKTIATFTLLFTFASHVPIIDTSNLECPDFAQMKIKDAIKESLKFGIDENEESEADFVAAREQMWEIGPLLCEWASNVIDRMLATLESIGEQSKAGFASIMAKVSVSLYISVIMSVLNSTDKVTRSKLVKKIGDFLIDKCIANAPQYAKALGRACAEKDDVYTFAKLVPAMVKILHSDTESTKKQTWALTVLGGVVRYSGERILPVKDALLDVIQKGLKNDDGSIRKLSGTLLRRVLRSLLTTYNRFGKFAIEDEQLAACLLGQGSSFHLDANGEFRSELVQWHVPTKDEIAFAGQLVNTFLPPIISQMESLMGSKEVAATSLSVTSTSSTERWKRLLRELFQIIRGIATHLPKFKQTFLEQDSREEGEHIEINAISIVAPGSSAIVSGDHTRESLIELSSKVLSHLRSKGVSIDTKSTVTTLKILVLLTTYFGLESGKVRGAQTEGGMEGLLGSASMFFASFTDSVDVSQPTPYLRQRKVLYRLRYGKDPDNDSGVLQSEYREMLPYIMYSSNIRGHILHRGTRSAVGYTRSRRLSIPDRKHFSDAGSVDLTLNVGKEFMFESKDEISTINGKAEACFNHFAARYKSTQLFFNTAILADFNGYASRSSKNSSSTMEVVGNGETDDAFAAKVIGSLKLLLKHQRIGWFQNRWSSFARFIRVLVFVAGEVSDSLPASKQPICQSLISNIFQDLLKGYRPIPILDNLDRRIRDSIVEDIVKFCESKPHWRRQMMSIACLVMLLQENQPFKLGNVPSLLPLSAWKLLVQSAQSEIVPLRVTAYRAINQVLCLACEDSENQFLPDEVVKMLSSEQILKMITDAMMEDRNGGESGGGDPRAKKNAQWSEGVEAVTRFVQGYYHVSPRIIHSFQGQSFSSSAGMFWRRYFDNCGLEAFPTVESLLRKLLFEAESSEIAKSRSIALEIISGVLRSLGSYIDSPKTISSGLSGKIDAEGHAKAKKSVFAILQQSLSKFTTESGKEWPSAFRFVASEGDLPWIRELLDFSMANLESLLKQNGNEPSELSSGSKLTHIETMMQTVRSLLIELVARINTGDEYLGYFVSVRDRLTPILFRGLESDFGGIRDNSAFIISFLSFSEFVQHHDTYDQWREQVLQFIETKCDKELQTPDSTKKSPVLSSVPALIGFTLTFNGFQCSLPICLRLLPIVFRMSSHPNAETSKRAIGALKAAAGFLRIWTLPAGTGVTTPEDLRVSTFLHMLVRVASLSSSESDMATQVKSTTWSDRANALQFLNTFCFHHMHFLTNEDEGLVLKTIEQSLQDWKLEVQEVAKVVLSAVVSRYQEEERVVQIRDRYLKLASTKVSKESIAAINAGMKRLRDGSDASAAVASASSNDAEPMKIDAVEEIEKKRQLEMKKFKMRHAGVLGLAAITLSSPYEIPNYLPKAVATLARHVTDPYPIGENAKSAVSKFKQTHQERWHEQKHHFTADELDDLDEGSNASYAYS